MTENQKYWQYLIDSYEDLINCGFDLLPLLNLVEWLSQSKYKDEIYPNKSIATLVISGVEDFHAQTDSPSLGVDYGNHIFLITYSSTNRTHNLVKYKCHSTQVFSLLESLFIRLDIETKIKLSSISNCSGESKQTSRR